MRLLKFWLLRFLFAGTFFFADGASSLAAVDGGGGDGGADAGGGDSGGGADAGDSDGTQGDGTDADADSADRSQSGDQNDGTDPNAQVLLADGRKVPAKYKELFEKDKNLRADYFNQRALAKVFPGGVKEAIGLAKQIEEFGGVDGIEKLQGDLEIYNADAEAFNSGDPKWIEGSFKENADLSLKHFTNALGYVSEHHPEHYDHLMAKVIVNDLQNLPVEKIYSMLKGIKDSPEAAALAQQLAKYYNSRHEFAKKVPEKQIDPQQRKLDEDRTKLTEEKQQVRNKTINVEAAPYLTRSIEGSVAAAAKAAQFDLAKLQKSQPNRYGRFLKDVRKEVQQEILGDEKWLDRYNDALLAGDTQKCIRMLNKRHDQAIKGTDEKPGVAATIFADWFGAPKAGNRRGNAAESDKGDKGASTGNGQARSFGKETPTQVNALPPAKDIDYSDPLTDKWNGIYRLKTGKLIQVKRP
jgi:hypothetical protein